MKLPLLILFAALLFHPVFAQDEGAETEEESIQSLTEERRELLLYGIDNQVIELINELKEEKDELLVGEVFAAYKLTRNPKVRTAIFDYFAEMFREKGFEFLAWAEIGDVHLFSMKEIRKVDDLKGLKIWTWSGDPISKETFSVLGSTPIPLSITDVTTALSTTMINTIYAPPLGAMSMQWDSKVKFMTLLPLAHSTATVIISLDYFDKIPKDLSSLLKTEIKEAM